MAEQTLILPSASKHNLMEVEHRIKLLLLFVCVFFILIDYLFVKQQKPIEYINVHASNADWIAELL